MTNFYTIERINHFGEKETLEDAVAQEVFLEIKNADGQILGQVYASPNQQEELIQGYRYLSQISGKSDVSRDNSNNSNKADLSPLHAMKAIEQLLRCSREFYRTGNIHCSALCLGEHLVYIGEDISRQNTICKAVGSCILQADYPDSYYLCTTGRISISMVKLVDAAGIKGLVSRSAPTDQAIIYAREHGIHLYGFASDEKINRYC